MPQCTCGTWYSGSYGKKGKYDIDACPACQAASMPETYTNSKQWVCENVSGDEHLYNPEHNDN